MSKKYSNEFSNSKNSTSNLENKISDNSTSKNSVSKNTTSKNSTSKNTTSKNSTSKTKKIVLININIFYKRNFVFVEAFCNLVQNAFTYVAKNMVQWMKLLVKKRKGIAYEKI